MRPHKRPAARQEASEINQDSSSKIAQQVLLPREILQNEESPGFFIIMSHVETLSGDEMRAHSGPDNMKLIGAMQQPLDAPNHEKTTPSISDLRSLVDKIHARRRDSLQGLYQVCGPARLPLGPSRGRMNNNAARQPKHKAAITHES